ncbi:MAG: serpin family protein [Candidatus Marinimicrobia bacterium]|nr:serpin family protein [Candidatus Neomarinimicrobiota bacterium]
MKKPIITGLLFVLIFITACAQRETVSKNDTGRLPSPVFVQEKAVEGLNAFAFDIYREMKGPDPENMFCSPLSISAALAMTYVGAGGETAREMRDVMYYGPQHREFHTKYGNMIDSLRSGDSAEFEMKIANALWVQKKYQLRSSYVQTVKSAYSSEARELDFTEDPEESRNIINKWVSDNTAGRIRDLLPGSAITPLTRLILTNAVYFNAEWEHRFNKEMTEKSTFYCLDGKKIEAEMMYQRHYYDYSETEAYQILDLSYKGGEYIMTVMLPRDHDGIKKLSGRINNEFLDKHDSLKQRKDVMVYLPKFRLETDYGLNRYLNALGMEKAFTPSADFSGMTREKELMISAVLHKAFIDVDEEKTEAAAATAVVMKLTSVRPSPMAPVEFRADHPFIFLIRHKKEKAILFIGNLIDPKRS